MIKKFENGAAILDDGRVLEDLGDGRWIDRETDREYGVIGKAGLPHEDYSRVCDLVSEATDIYFKSLPDEFPDSFADDFAEFCGWLIEAR